MGSHVGRRENRGARFLISQRTRSVASSAVESGESAGDDTVLAGEPQNRTTYSVHSATPSASRRSRGMAARLRLWIVELPLMRSNLSRSVARSLAALLAAGITLTGVQLAVLPYDTPAGALVAAFPVLFLVFLCAGLTAWYRRPSNGMGPLICAAGLSLYLAGFGNSYVPAFETVGLVFGTLILAMVVHLLHAFPSGRLHGKLSVVTVVLVYLNSVVLQTASYLLDDRLSDRLQIAHRPDIVVGVNVAQNSIGMIATVFTAIVLIGRIRAAHGQKRVTLIWVYGYAVLAVFALVFASAILGPVLGFSPLARGVFQLVVIAGVPIAFALAVLRGGFARTGELVELGSWLGTADFKKPSLGAALASVLGDSSLRLAYWVPVRNAFVDERGNTLVGAEAPCADASSNATRWEPTAGPRGALGAVSSALEPTDDSQRDGQRDPTRATVEITVEGRLVGAITYDATLIADPELVRTAGRVVAIAVDRERLTAELNASRLALQRSRERLVDAADLERHRIAQDLHDGLQMQLVLLGIEAQQLAKAQEATPSVSDSAIRLRKGIDAAAADLRELVHEVMPAALVEQGLAAAVEDLVDRLPVPASLTLTAVDIRAPLAVQRTAYFVVAEALTNTVKHANATEVAVRLENLVDTVVIEIHDNGVGGAELKGGSGLRGLVDRVDVLGGVILIVSPVGEGTKITVELPCV
jgi:signal transduction histidine kinase